MHDRDKSKRLPSQAPQPAKAGRRPEESALLAVLPTQPSARRAEPKRTTPTSASILEAVSSLQKSQDPAKRLKLSSEHEIKAVKAVWAAVCQPWSRVGAAVTADDLPGEVQLLASRCLFGALAFCTNIMLNMRQIRPHHKLQ